MSVGDEGASALAAALDRGALPRLKNLGLDHCAISDAALVALAPALRRRPALEEITLRGNRLGDEGLAALVAPPAAAAGAPPPTTGGLTRLKVLYLSNTKVTDAGCATLTSALDSGALPALSFLDLDRAPASAAAQAAVRKVVMRAREARRRARDAELARELAAQMGQLSMQPLG
jgi:hypothetical protein